MENVMKIQKLANMSSPSTPPPPAAPKWHQLIGSWLKYCILWDPDSPYPVNDISNYSKKKKKFKLKQRCLPSIFQREAPYFCKHICPFWHPNLATSLFLASFVPLTFHVILKTSLFFVWILPIFWMLMLASLLKVHTLRHVQYQRALVALIHFLMW